MLRRGARIEAFLRVAARLDDDALAAIATRGLVRRAHKELQRTPPVLGAIEGEQLLFSVDDRRGKLALDPRESRCDCAARRTCGHVVTAWLALRAQAAQTAVPAGEPIAVDEIAQLLAVDDEALARWATAPRLRRAMLAAARGLQLVVASERPLVLQLPALRREVRSLGGGRLEQLLCSCHAHEPCEHRVAAVLALQAARGARAFDVERLASNPALDTPRDRGAILDSVAELLGTLIAQGLARGSSALRVRARGLSTAAAALELPRLEQALRSLALELELFAAHSPRASADSLLLRAAELEALRAALYAPRDVGLIGAARTRYANVGTLQLQGIGARAFMTRAGPLALACYFWDGEAQAFNSWTALCRGARSTPSLRFRRPGPWLGCASPEHASRHALRLAGAFRSASGRLSGRMTTHMQALGASDLEQVPAVDDWRVLFEHAARVFGAGIRREEHEALVMIQPSAFEPGAFDPVEQRWSCRARDRAQRVLELVWEHDACSARAIRWSERNPTARWQRVLGLLRLRSHGVQLEPISIVCAGQLVSPTLPAARTAPGGARDLAEDEHDDEWSSDDGERDAPLHAQGPLGTLLSAAWAALSDAAEHGTRDTTRALVPAALRRQLSAVGLEACAAALPVPSAQGEEAARQLLRAAYVIAATQRALVLAATTIS